MSLIVRRASWTRLCKACTRLTPDVIAAESPVRSSAATSIKGNAVSNELSSERQWRTARNHVHAPGASMLQQCTHRPSRCCKQIRQNDTAKCDLSLCKMVSTHAWNRSS